MTDSLATDRLPPAFRRMFLADSWFKRLPVGIYCCDRDGVLLQFNHRAAELWGRAPDLGGQEERFCGAHRLFLLDGSILPHAATPMAQVLRTGTAVRDQTVIIERPDGTRVTVLVTIDPVFDDEGVLEGAINCFQDVTELTRAQAALQANERQLNTYLEALPAAVYTTDAEGRILFYNQAVVELAGREPELGTDQWCVSWRLYHPDGTPLPHDQCPMALALKEQQPIRGAEAVAERPDGTKVLFAAHPTPLFDDDGHLTGAVNMLVDITARRKAEEQAAQLAAIVASSDDAIISKTLGGRITSWNASATRIFGYEASEMIGQSITRIIPPDLQEEERSILARLQRGEHIDHYETVRVTRDGRRLDISLTVSPVCAPSGRIIGASKVARDITERKQAEQTQQLLISELNHRVRNTLTVVQAIANQTLSRAKGPSEFVASFRGRIQALALTHTLLSQANWRGAELQALVHDHLLFDRTERDRILTSGPSLLLDAQVALHLALVLHELSTNAHKHGSLSVPDGRVEVTWTVQSREGSSDLLLQWKEMGGPAVSAPSTRGFGTTLIEQSLQAHGGEASLQYASDGITCTIRWPLPDSTRNTHSPATMAEPRTVPDDRLEGSHAASFDGRRVLVIEDEPLVAMDLVASLRDAGCVVVGPATTVAKVRSLIEQEQLDAALVDVNLAGQPADELVVSLSKCGVPFAFITGYGRKGLPQAFREAPMIGKPFDPNQLRDLLEQLLQNSGDVVRLSQRTLPS